MQGWRKSSARNIPSGWITFWLTTSNLRITACALILARVAAFSAIPAARRPIVSQEASPWWTFRKSACGELCHGGGGANPLPAHHQEIWNVGKDSLAGGFLYSEGIFEDLNKVLYAQFYWQKGRPVGSIMDEYIAYEFSPKVVAPVRRAIEILETNFPRRDENIDKGEPRFVMEHSSGIEEALNLIRQADNQLPSWARASWRW